MSHRNTLKKKKNTSSSLKLLKISIFSNHITKITKFNYTIHISTFKDPSAILYLSNLSKKKKKRKEKIPCPIETLKKKKKMNTPSSLKLLKISIFLNHITKITKFNLLYTLQRSKILLLFFTFKTSQKKKKKKKSLLPLNY